MKTLLMTMTLTTTLLLAAGSFAQTSPPAGSTGMCKDGTYWTGASKQGACHGHQGVKDWYGAAATAPAAAATTAPAATAPRTKTAAATNTTPQTTSPTTSHTTAMPATAAPGGGSGQVWANKDSKTYHCSTDKWYGKTKDGEYMTEQAAKSAGYHPDHGKPCS